MSTPNGATTMTVAGGNLMLIAAQVYGDASQWNRIAAVNGLWDFVVTGLATLTIPPADNAAANGGILGL